MDLYKELLSLSQSQSKEIPTMEAIKALGSVKMAPATYLGLSPENIQKEASLNKDVAVDTLNLFKEGYRTRNALQKQEFDTLIQAHDVALKDKASKLDEEFKKFQMAESIHNRKYKDTELAARMQDLEKGKLELESLPERIKLENNKRQNELESSRLKLESDKLSLSQNVKKLQTIEKIQIPVQTADDNGILSTKFVPADVASMLGVDFQKAYENHIKSSPTMATQQSLISDGFSPSAAANYDKIKSDYTTSLKERRESAVKLATSAGSRNISEEEIRRAALDEIISLWRPLLKPEDVTKLAESITKETNAKTSSGRSEQESLVDEAIRELSSGRKNLR